MIMRDRQRKRKRETEIDRQRERKRVWKIKREREKKKRDRQRQRKTLRERADIKNHGQGRDAQLIIYIIKVLVLLGFGSNAGILVGILTTKPLIF